MTPFSPAFLFSLALAGTITGNAIAEDSVGVVGLFPGKAVLVVNGAAPKTYSAGARITDGIRLVAVGESNATIEVNGRHQTIPIGSQAMHAGSGTGPTSAVMSADGRGHFMVNGLINGGSMLMMVDTGATMIALPAKDALRLGIDYRKGEIGQVNTANGLATAYRVKLDTVRIGDIELHQVDALIQENGLNMGLLGMSFLNRTVMQRDGETMTLTKRF
jgi:aspartyl protease family protein